MYIGVTNDLIRRIYEHKNNFVQGFTQRYNLHIVYFELTKSIESAIQQEKRLKNWKRQWKIELIDRHNPEWNDLYPSIV